MIYPEIKPGAEYFFSTSNPSQDPSEVSSSQYNTPSGPGVVTGSVPPPDLSSGSRPLRAAAARARAVKGRLRTPATPGNMAALMSLSQVTTLNSSRKVSNLNINPYQVSVTVAVRSNHFTCL